MDSFLSIFQGTYCTKETFLDIFADGLVDLGKFDGQSNKGVDIVQHVSALLNKSTTHSAGLRLLLKLIDHCSNDIFDKKKSFWTTLILKTCNNQEFKYDAPLIFEVLGKLVKRSSQFVDLTKSFASTHICKIYECLINVSSFQAKHALRCIETCLRLYPGSSSVSKNAIECFLWKNVDHVDDDVVQNCGKCLHLLQQVKAGVGQGVNHKTQWKKYQLLLLGGINTMYNNMFTNCIESYEDKINEEKLPYESQAFQYEPEPLKKAAQMYTRCHNLIQFLVIALREPFPVEKQIMIKKILNVVIRGLSVDCVMLEQTPIVDNIALSILLPKLHVNLLELLNVAILILRGHLRPYSDIILRLITDGLKWTSAKNGNQKQLVLRKQIYETFSLWCKILHGGNRCDTIGEYLFQEILSDITPTQSEITLKVLSCARKHTSKKGRCQLNNAHNEQTNMDQTYAGACTQKEHVSEKKHQELCISALRCLQEFIFSVGHFIKPTLLKIIHTSITLICASLYELPSKSTHLYSDKHCRIEIFNTLYAILMSPHNLCPPPTEMASIIIQTAFTCDDSLKVQTRCGFLLQNLEKSVHPQKESLLFTIEARDIRNTFIQMGQECLLSGFQFNYLQTPLRNNATGDINDLELNRTLNLQYSNILLSEHKKKYDDSSDNIEVIEYKNQNINKIQPCIDHVTDILVKEAIKHQTDNDNEFINIPESPDFVLRVDDDGDSAIVDENDNKTDSNIDKLVTKKQKLNNRHITANKVEISKPDTVSYVISQGDDEDVLLADIASQFVDELN